MAEKMTRSLRGSLLQAFALACAAVPFAFALIRAVQTGTDFRYFWVALGGLCGAAATMAVARRYDHTSKAAVALPAAVFATATLLAVLAALSIGTSLGPGILVVGAGFGFCLAASSLFLQLAR
jgi:hypothetical protein